MATDADTILFNSTDDTITARIRAAWPGHCAHPFLPRKLGCLLGGTGFEIIERKVHVIVNHEFDPEYFGWHMARAMSVYAAKQGAIAKDEGKAWIAGLRDLEETGAFFFSMNRYLFLTEKQPART
jgi:hypothetical protein